MHETGIARLAVSVALCEASIQEDLRFNPDDPAVNEAAPPTSAGSASIQLPWTRRQGYLSAALVRRRRLTVIHRALPLCSGYSPCKLSRNSWSGSEAALAVAGRSRPSSAILARERGPVLICAAAVARSRAGQAASF